MKGAYAQCVLFLLRDPEVWLLRCLSASLPALVLFLFTEECHLLLMRIHHGYEKSPAAFSVVFLCSVVVYALLLLLIYIITKKCRCSCVGISKCLPDNTRRTLAKWGEQLAKGTNIMARILLVIAFPMCSAVLGARLKSTLALVVIALLVIGIMFFFMYVYSLEFKRIQRQLQRPETEARREDAAESQPSQQQSGQQQQTGTEPQPRGPARDARTQTEQLINEQRSGVGEIEEAEETMVEAEALQCQNEQPRTEEVAGTKAGAETQKREPELEILVEDLGLMDVLIAVALGIVVQFKQNMGLLLTLTALPGAYKIVMPFPVQLAVKYATENLPQKRDVEAGNAPPSQVAPPAPGDAPTARPTEDAPPATGDAPTAPPSEDAPPRH